MQDLNNLTQNIIPLDNTLSIMRKHAKFASSQCLFKAKLSPVSIMSSNSYKCQVYMISIRGTEFNQVP